MPIPGGIGASIPDGKQAAAAVRFRGHWFYIADDDQDSKSTLLLLDQLFALQAVDILFRADDDEDSEATSPASQRIKTS